MKRFPFFMAAFITMLGCTKSVPDECANGPDPIFSAYVQLAERALASTGKSVAFSETCAAVHDLGNDRLKIKFVDRANVADGNRTGRPTQAATIRRDNGQVEKINLNLGGYPDIWFDYKYPVTSPESRTSNAESLRKIDILY